MAHSAYQKLARVLDTLPNGFPATEDGIEIRLLEKIFEPEEAELFCELKLTFETAQQIAERTGRPIEELAAGLETMMEKGQIFGVDLGGVKLYKMLPWAFGIYEFQMPRMDREMAELCEAYANVYAGQFLSQKPQMMQVIPIESEVAGDHEALSFEKVSSIIEKSESLMYFDCVCKKGKALLGEPCDRPVQVCTAYAPLPGIFENNHFGGKTMTRQEAYELLERTEKEGLVHLTWNIKSGHYFICNCCGCCCSVLRGINELGIKASHVIRSSYYAQIDPELCEGCGLCADQRCQVHAIEQEGDVYRVITEKCIGCGLCVSTCPNEAVSLIRKPEDQIETPPEDELDWYQVRARMRGVDITPYT
ncbi:MAG: ATP-binding protein [Desulfobacterales bacterium]